MELAALKIKYPADCCETTFYKNFSGDADGILAATKSSKKHWICNRQFRITGSRIYQIYTYKGVDWQKKAASYFFPKGFTNKYVEHGLRNEAAARVIFCEKMGVTAHECGFIISEANPWLGYSPDGVIFNSKEYPQALLEIKCPFAGKLCHVYIKFIFVKLQIYYRCERFNR